MPVRQGEGERRVKESGEREERERRERERERERERDQMHIRNHEPRKNDCRTVLRESVPRPCIAIYTHIYTYMYTYMIVAH